MTFVAKLIATAQVSEKQVAWSLSVLVAAVFPALLCVSAQALAVLSTEKEKEKD